jgi:hypothetical protein
MARWDLEYPEQPPELDEEARARLADEYRLLRAKMRKAAGPPEPPVQQASSSSDLWSNLADFAIAKGARFLKGITEPTGMLLRQHPVYGGLIKRAENYWENKVRGLEQAGDVGEPMGETGLVTTKEWNKPIPGEPPPPYEVPFTSKMAQTAGQWVGTPIPFLRGPTRLTQALRNIPPVAALSGGMEALHQLELPPEQQKWSEVPKSAAAGGLIGAAFGGIMRPRGRAALPEAGVEPYLLPEPTPPPPPVEPLGLPETPRLRLPPPEIPSMQTPGRIMTPQELSRQVPRVIRQPGREPLRLPAPYEPPAAAPGSPRELAQGSRVIPPQEQAHLPPKVVYSEPPTTEPLFATPRTPEPPLVLQRPTEAPRPLEPSTPQPGELFPGQETMQIGSKPLIGRDVDLTTAATEAPLFSRAAQEPAPEQIGLPGQPTTVGRGAIPESWMAGLTEPKPIVMKPPFREPVVERARQALEEFKGWQADPGGYRLFHEGQTGGESLVTGVPSNRAEWYKALTTGKGALKKQEIEGILSDLSNNVMTRNPKKVELVLQGVLGREYEAMMRGKGWAQAEETVKPQTASFEQYAETDHVPRLDELPPGANPIEQETMRFSADDRSWMQGWPDDMKRLFEDEAGYIKLGDYGKMGALGKYVLNGRRVAEIYPEYRPYYEHVQVWNEAEAAKKWTLLKKLETYGGTAEETLAKVDPLLRARRRGRTINPASLPPDVAAALLSHDEAMKQARTFIEQALAQNGMPPLNPMSYYTPFMRTGDYLVIREARPADLMKRLPALERQVMAFPTLKQAHDAIGRLDLEEPLAMHKLQIGTAEHAPVLDFGTVHMLRQANLLNDSQLRAAVERFNLPPGFAAHFKQAANTLGEEATLMNPLRRYLDGVAQWTTRMEMEGRARELIEAIPKTHGDVRDYATKHLEYIQQHPNEFSAVRGAVATYDLAFNVAAMGQNATQLLSVGVPNFQRAFGPTGPKTLAKATKDVFARAGGRTLLPVEENVLRMAEQEGVTSPINAMELWGRSITDPSQIELGGKLLFRGMKRGGRIGQVSEALIDPMDRVAEMFRGGAQTYEKIQPILMWGYSHIEKANRQAAVLGAYRAAVAKGASPAAAYQQAKAINRNINFDYSRFSRPPAFRGAGAPLGLFATFQTEYLSTLSKYLGEAARGMAAGDPKKAIPFVTAAGLFATFAGVKGGLFQSDINEWTGGRYRRAMPEVAWRGPMNWLTGFDISSKYAMRLPLPVDVGRGTIDLHNLPITSPAANAFDAAALLQQGPMDAATGQVAMERVAPPAIKNVMQGLRWAGVGPAGKLEGGQVGTPRGHTPGPTPEGKHEFFKPTPGQITGKIIGLNPEPLATMQEKNVEQRILQEQYKEQRSELVNRALRDLQRQGLSFEQGREASAIRQLHAESPQSYREILKAYRDWQRAGRPGSLQQFYRKAQEPPVLTPDLKKIPRKPSDYRKPGYVRPGEEAYAH